MMGDPTRRGFIGMVAAIPVAAKTVLLEVGRRKPNQSVIIPAEEAAITEKLERDMPNLTIRLFSSDGQMVETPCKAEPMRDGTGASIVSDPFPDGMPMIAETWEVRDEYGNVIVGGDLTNHKSIHPNDSASLEFWLEENSWPMDHSSLTRLASLLGPGD